MHCRRKYVNVGIEVVTGDIVAAGCKYAMYKPPMYTTHHLCLFAVRDNWLNKYVGTLMLDELSGRLRVFLVLRTGLVCWQTTQ